MNTNSLCKRVFLALGTALLLCLTGCDSGNDTDAPYEPIPLTRSEQEIVANGNDLGYKMLKTTYNAGLNTVESPLSLTYALGMLANGAQGETLDEIMDLLGVENIDELNSCMDKVDRNLRGADRKVTLEIASSLWFNKGFQPKPEYKEPIKAGYDAELHTEQLDSDAAMKSINKWCSNKTNGMINNFLSEPLRNVDMALYNAMYFYGEWSEKFDPKKTENKYFHNADGSGNTVPMMYQTKGLSNYREDEYSQSIQVPYGNGNFYMELELPAKDKTVSEVIEARLNGETPESQTVLKVRLRLPRFKAAYKFNVNDMLLSMGKNHILKETDYSLISEKNPRLGTILQATVIEVDENGTKAATVTGSGGVISPSIELVELIFDRPFLYSIKEKSTGATLFCGVINKL